MTSPSPSVSERAVCTARPSFQKIRMTAPTMRPKPISTPMMDCPSRDSQDWCVVSVMLSIGD